MSMTFLTWRLNYGETDKIDKIIDFCNRAKNDLLTNEDAEFIVKAVPEHNIITFHIASLRPTDNIDPSGNYDVDIHDTLTLLCTKDFMNDDGQFLKKT